MHFSHQLRTTRREFLRRAAACTALSGLIAFGWRSAKAVERDPEHGIGLSLNLGLNNLDNQGFYRGGAPPLGGCHNDAKAMARIAERHGYLTPHILLDDAANYYEVRRHIIWAAKILQPGDTFLCTISSHGTDSRDENGDESDGDDEAWCLFDNWLIDDEFESWCGYFKPGVNLVVVIDSCHSGTAVTVPGDPSEKWKTWNVPVRRRNSQKRDVLRLTRFNSSRSKLLPGELTAGSARSTRRISPHALTRPAAKKFCGTELRQQACCWPRARTRNWRRDGDENGLFTFALLQAMQQRPNNYTELFQAIQHKLRKSPQSPNLLPFGEPSSALASRVPFELG